MLYIYSCMLCKQIFLTVSCSCSGWKPDGRRRLNQKHSFSSHRHLFDTQTRENKLPCLLVFRDHSFNKNCCFNILNTISFYFSYIVVTVLAYFLRIPLLNKNYFGNQEAQIGCIDTLVPLKSKKHTGFSSTATTCNQ